MIELSILKKIGMRAQLIELTEETLFLRILGPSGLAQGRHGPNSYIFLISCIRPILLDIKTIKFNFFVVAISANLLQLVLRLADVSREEKWLNRKF